MSMQKMRITIEGPPKTGCSVLAVKVARLIRGHNPGMPLSVSDPDAVPEAEVPDDHPLFVDDADVSIVVRRTADDRLSLDDIGQGTYAVMFGRKCVGTAYRLEDGCYYYDQETAHGVMSAWSMRAIADKLDELNREWEELIAKMG